MTLHVFLDKHKSRSAQKPGWYISITLHFPLSILPEQASSSAHISPTWCLCDQTQAQAEKGTLTICQHTRSALLKTLAKAYTPPKCLSKCIPMWCLSASPGSCLPFSQQLFCRDKPTLTSAQACYW